MNPSITATSETLRHHRGALIAMNVPGGAGFSFTGIESIPGFLGKHQILRDLSLIIESS